MEFATILTGIGIGTAFSLLILLMLVILVIGRLNAYWEKREADKAAERLAIAEQQAHDKALAAVIGVSAMLARQSNSK